jgi:transposase
MVASSNTEGKDSGRWVASLWSEQSPPWQEIDADLPADDVARQIDEAVEMFLDLSGLEQSYAGRGHRAYPPRPLLKLVLYAKHRGWHRPSEWDYEARNNRVCRWLMRGLCPSRPRWYAFAKRIATRVDEWNAQTLSIAVEAKVTEATRGVQDGTLIAANATRHKLVSEEKIAQRVAALGEASERDGAGEPVTLRGAWMAKTPCGRRQQLRRYQLLSVAMARRQEENRQRPKSERKPPEKVRLSPGDPEAPLGLDKQRVFRPLYNVQLIDDLDSPLILAYEAFDQSSDNGTSSPMLVRHRRLTGAALKELLADSKYTTPADLAVFARAEVTLYGHTQEQTDSLRKASRSQGPSRQIPKSHFVWLDAEDAYQCPEGHRLPYRASRTRRCAGGEIVRTTIYACPANECQACPRRSQCTPSTKAGREVRRSEHEPLLEALTARMATPEAQSLYRRRQETVELAFADFKEHRKLVRFSGHGLSAARAEVGLSVLVHNTLSLLAALRQTSQTLAPCQPP